MEQQQQQQCSFFQAEASLLNIIFINFNEDQHGLYSCSSIIGMSKCGGRGLWSEEGKDKYLFGFGDET